jgi:hypothetical protein
MFAKVSEQIAQDKAKAKTPHPGRLRGRGNAQCLAGARVAGQRLRGRVRFIRAGQRTRKASLLWVTI